MGLVNWKGKTNPLVEAVQAISINGKGKRDLTPEEQELEDMRGPVVAESWDKDPRNPANRETKEKDQTRPVQAGDEVLPAWLVEGDDVASENGAGSYESLLRGWGGESKRAFSTEVAAGPS